MVPPLCQNIVGVRNQITFLILYYISSRLLTLRKAIDTPIFYCILGLTVSFKFINFIYYIFHFFSETSIRFTSTLFRLPTLLWFALGNHCILACLFKLKTVNIPHQTMIYDASIHTDLDYLLLRF